MEWLKDILGEELYNQTKAKLDEAKIKIGNLSDGSYIPREKFNEKNEENKILKEQIDEYQKKGKEIDKLVSSNQELKNQVDSLNNDFNAKLAEKDSQISNMAKTTAINKILADNKVVYPDLILKGIDLNSVELDGDNIKNFDIESIKKSYPNMFETVQQQGNVNPGNTSPFANKGESITKKSQLIQEYNNTTDITAKYKIRQQINQLKE